MDHRAQEGRERHAELPYHSVRHVQREWLEETGRRALELNCLQDGPERCIVLGYRRCQLDTEGRKKLARLVVDDADLVERVRQTVDLPLELREACLDGIG